MFWWALEGSKELFASLLCWRWEISKGLGISHQGVLLNWEAKECGYVFGLQLPEFFFKQHGLWPWCLDTSRSCVWNHNMRNSVAAPRHSRLSWIPIKFLTLWIKKKKHQQFREQMKYSELMYVCSQNNVKPRAPGVPFSPKMNAVISNGSFHAVVIFERLASLGCTRKSLLSPCPCVSSGSTTHPPALWTSIPHLI